MRRIVSRDVRHEQRVVVRVGTVPRVGQPEVLPHDDAVAVAGFVEFVVAGLPDPVADHGEVHVAVVADGGVVLARRGSAASIRGKPQLPPRGMKRRPLIHMRSAPPSSLKANWRTPALKRFVSETPRRAGLEAQLDVVEIRIAVAGRPPELRILQPQRRDVSTDRASPYDGRRLRDVTGTSNVTSPKRPRRVPVTGCRVVIAQRDRDAARRRATCRAAAASMLTDGFSTVTGPVFDQEDVVPDAGVAAADRGNPVPADGRVIGRIVGARARRRSCPGVSNVFSLTLPGVAFFSTRTASALGCPARSRDVTSNRPRMKPPSMRPSFSPFRKTSAFQLMPSKFSQTRRPARGRRRVELVAVPEVGVEERVGDHQLVVAEVRDRAGRRRSSS